MIQLPDSVWEIFRCGFCGSPLEKSDVGAVCRGCTTTYPYTENASLDLRLQRSRDYPLTFPVGEPPLSDDELSFMPLTRDSRPKVDFTGMKVPHHLTPELLDRFPKARSGGGMMLDLGCGTGLHQSVCEHAGFQWVGLDYGETGAPIWGDAHALPFADDSFDFILTIAVLEHIRYPFVMIQEARRVLKPGGKIIGTVSFLEPFHAMSHYHHSHLGTLNVLRYGGFDVEDVAPLRAWMALRAQASMGLFPKMPALLSRLIVAPVDILHRLWWRAAGMVSPKATEAIRLRMTAGSFTFVATKPE